MIETAKARDAMTACLGGGRNAQRTSAAIEQRRIHVVCADSVRDRGRLAGGWQPNSDGRAVSRLLLRVGARRGHVFAYKSSCTSIESHTVRSTRRSRHTQLEITQLDDFWRDVLGRVTRLTGESEDMSGGWSGRLREGRAVEYDAGDQAARRAFGRSPTRVRARAPSRSRHSPR